MRFTVITFAILVCSLFLIIIIIVVFVVYQCWLIRKKSTITVSKTSSDDCWQKQFLLQFVKLYDFDLRGINVWILFLFLIHVNCLVGLAAVPKRSGKIKEFACVSFLGIVIEVQLVYNFVFGWHNYASKTDAVWRRPEDEYQRREAKDSKSDNKAEESKIRTKRKKRNKMLPTSVSKSLLLTN